MFNRRATLPIDVELNKGSPEDTLRAFSHMQLPDQKKLELKRSDLLDTVLLKLKRNRKKNLTPSMQSQPS